MRYWNWRCSIPNWNRIVEIVDSKSNCWLELSTRLDFNNPSELRLRTRSPKIWVFSKPADIKVMQILWKLLFWGHRGHNFWCRRILEINIIKQSISDFLYKLYCFINSNILIKDPQISQDPQIPQLWFFKKSRNFEILSSWIDNFRCYFGFNLDFFFKFTFDFSYKIQATRENTKFEYLPVCRRALKWTWPLRREDGDGV